MTPWYATNARGLLEARKQGRSPPGPVVVSLVGQHFTETALFLRPDMPADRLDWRMLVNLDVWVWASAEVSMQWIVDTTWRIARVRPKELTVRFEHSGHVHDVDCGSGHHLPAVADIAPVHQFQWAPINVGGTALGKRIKQALLAAHPYGEIL